MKKIKSKNIKPNKPDNWNKTPQYYYVQYEITVTEI